LATQVYDEEVISLQDGTEVTLRPLPIAALRRFFDAWAKASETDEEQESFTVFVNCAGVALEKHFKEKFDSTRPTEAQSKKGEFLSEEYKKYLEGVLDLETIYKILDVCGGLKLNIDPKAIQEAMREEAPGEN
jgi:hypothetical protein